MFWLCTLPTLLSRRRDAATNRCGLRWIRNLCTALRSIARSRGNARRSVAMFRGMADPNWNGRPTGTSAPTTPRRSCSASAMQSRACSTVSARSCAGCRDQWRREFCQSGCTRRQPGGLDRHGSRRIAGGAFGGGQAEASSPALHVDFTAPTPAPRMERRRMPVVRSESARSFRPVLALAVLHHVLVCPDGSPGRSTVEAGLLHALASDHRVCRPHRCDVRRTRARAAWFFRRSIVKASSARSLGISRIDEQVEIIPGRHPVPVQSGSVLTLSARQAWLPRWPGSLALLPAWMPCVSPSRRGARLDSSGVGAGGTLTLTIALEMCRRASMTRAPDARPCRRG